MQFSAKGYDIDMERHVDLRSSSSLDEAITLATQYESFEMGENSGSMENNGRLKSANV